jgi:hypothetical protein
MKIISSVYVWTMNSIRFSTRLTKISHPQYSFFIVCNNDSKHKLNNNGFNRHLYFIPHFHPIFFIFLPFISITDVIPSCIFTIIFCIQSGKFHCFIVDIINLCGIDPNAFMKSIVVTTRWILFRFTLCSNSFKIISRSLNLFIFLIIPFWLSEKM